MHWVSYQNDRVCLNSWRMDFNLKLSFINWFFEDFGKNVL